MASQPNIEIAVITGSVRPGSYTSKAVALVIDELEKDQEVKVTVIDPSKLLLSFPGMAGDTAAAQELRESVSRATGVILATPEYHGSFSSIMKLVIENLGFPSALSGKPVALLGVAGGQIGAIKSLEALASVCMHVGALVLPGSVSVASVRKVFDENGRCRDAAVEKRIRSVARNLTDYLRQHLCPSIALEAMVRESEG